MSVLICCLYLEERNAESDTVPSQHVRVAVSRAKGDATFVRVETASQLKGGGGRKGKGRKGYGLARKHTRLAISASGLQGTTEGNLISYQCEGCAQDFSQKT